MVVVVVGVVVAVAVAVGVGVGMIYLLLVFPAACGIPCEHIYASKTPMTFEYCYDEARPLIKTLYLFNNNERVWVLCRKVEDV